jgi:GNAT superfamily N-acetyltransferase
MYKKSILNEQFIVRTAIPSDASQMEFVQITCFPTLSADEILNKKHFANHIKVFQEGQLVVEKDGKIVGSASTLRCFFPEHDHTFMESCDNLWITNAHFEDGDWMYGLDMGVLPEYRGLGLSKEMYKARMQVCIELGLKGQIIAGMVPGYGKVKDLMTIEQYCEKLRIGEMTDPTIAPQQKSGFRWIRALFDYLDDPNSGNASILMYKPVDENYFIDDKYKTAQAHP